ncbi:hypothetical protein GN956_G21022 [Arapaima gigas]
MMYLRLLGNEEGKQRASGQSPVSYAAHILGLRRHRDEGGTPASGCCTSISLGFGHHSQELIFAVVSYALKSTSMVSHQKHPARLAPKPVLDMSQGPLWVHLNVLMRWL